MGRLSWSRSLNRLFAVHSILERLEFKIEGQRHEYKISTLRQSIWAQAYFGGIAAPIPDDEHSFALHERIKT